MHKSTQFYTKLGLDSPNVAGQYTPSFPVDMEMQVAPNTVTSNTTAGHSEIVQSDLDHSDSDEEPNAADYDPTDDRRKEAARANERNTGATVSHQPLEIGAAAYNEKDEELPLVRVDREVLIPHSSVHPVARAGVSDPMFTEPSAAQATSAKSTENDMFAEEEDMFASPSAVTKTQPIIQAPMDATALAPIRLLDNRLSDSWDDSEGYYNVIGGEILDSRYILRANLGKGMFSSVVRADDQTNNQQVAIKIIRSNETM